MLEMLKTVVETLNMLSPLGLAAGLGFIIWKLIEGNNSLETVKTNHLHPLPEITETLRRMESAQTVAFTKMITLLELIAERQKNGHD